MKFSKILTIVLAVLCVAAVGLSLVSAINIGNDKTDNGKTDGTSSETPSDSPDETMPDGSQDPTDSTSDLLVGSYVKTAADFENTESVTRVTGGLACVKQIDNVTYCYVKYDASPLSVMYVTYYNQSFDGVSNVFRVSYDESNWSLLNNYRIDYLNDWNQAKVPKNGDSLCICFYTITDNDKSLAETLVEFEERLSENTKVFISNIGG